jgi:hypothetical protein
MLIFYRVLIIILYIILAILREKLYRLYSALALHDSGGFSKTVSNFVSRYKEPVPGSEITVRPV